MRERLGEGQQWAIGAYEKCFPADLSLAEVLAAAAELGFHHIELSIDESEERRSRLAWSAAECIGLADAARRAKIEISAVVASGLRAVALGSDSSEVRSAGRKMLAAALDLAIDIEAPAVMIPGYFLYEPSVNKTTMESRARFVEALQTAGDLAERRGLKIGIENVDGVDVLSAADLNSLIADIGHRAVGSYLDIGNLVGNRLDIADQIRQLDHLPIGVHLKDARAGVFRRVPYGAGDVDFDVAIKTLFQMGYVGRFTLEMWNDGIDLDALIDARVVMTERLQKHAANSTYDVQLAHREG